MQILSIGKIFEYKTLDIINISLQKLSFHKELDRYDYISGGDRDGRKCRSRLLRLSLFYLVKKYSK